MNVVDSSAWMAWFADNRNAENFAAAINDTANLLVPSITITEVFKSLVRQGSKTQALHATSRMKQGIVVPLDSGLAVDAATCGLKFRLPLADSIIYATARRFDALLWTQDADFKDLPNVKYFP